MPGLNMDSITTVANMVLDTSGFTKGAEETLSTIDKLKQALNFEGAARGLENFGAQLKGTSMDALYNGVNSVKEGFNALDVVATRVLQNITDKVQNVATDLVEKITVEPLKAGLQEYETQINSVQTILANTNDALMEQGLTTEHDRIEKINGVLDELNHYADMTIYNFTEMTRNIGTFTAAGVELDTAATSIQGIANLAAMSGSNSQQASTAMYQLSQAIASGSVKLQDWNSVVNAGMGGKLFQNELIDTAKAMGVVDEQFVALTEGTTTFRESLSSGWLSADVLTNTLEKFTAGTEGYTQAQLESMQQLWRARGYSEKQIQDLTSSIHVLTEEEEANVRQKWYDKGFTEEQVDHIMQMGAAATDAATKVKTFTQLLETVGEALQSGWTQSWEYVIGDFEQAKMLWTEVSDIMNNAIGKSADKRNKILEEWSRAAYSYNEAGELIRTVDGEIVEGGKMVASEMGGREAIIQGLRNAFQGLYEIASQFSDAWNAGFWRTGTDDDISITAQKLIDLSHRFEEFTRNFKESLGTWDNPSEKLKAIREIFDRLANSARRAFDGIRDTLSGIGNIFKSFFSSKIFSMDTFASVANALERITFFISNFGKAVEKHFGEDSLGRNRDGLIRLFDGIERFANGVVTARLEVIDGLLKVFGTIIDHILPPGETFATMLGHVGDAMQGLADIFQDASVINVDMPRLQLMFEDISLSIGKFIDTIKKNVDFSGFQRIFDAIAGFIREKPSTVFSTVSYTIQGFVNVLETLAGVLSPIIGAVANFVADIIPDVLTFLNELASRFVNLTNSIKPTSETMHGIQNLFNGIFAVVESLGHLIANVFIAAWDKLGEILKGVLPTQETLASTLNNVGEKLQTVAKFIEDLANGENGAPKLSDIFGTLTDKVGGFFNVLKDLNPLEKLHELITKIADGIKRALGGTEDMSLLDTIFEKLKNFLNRIKDLFSDQNGQLDFVKIFEAGGIGYAIKRIFDLMKSIKDTASNASGVFKIINEFKDMINGLIESFHDQAKAAIIKNIGTSVLELAAAMFVIAMIDPVELAKATAAMGVLFQAIERVLVITSTIDAKKVAAAAAEIVALGTSMLELAVAVKILGSMDTMEMCQGLIGVGVLIEGMLYTVDKLSKMSNDMPKVVGTLMGIAIALNLLVIPVKIMGSMDLADLAKGLGAVAVGLGLLVGSLLVLNEFASGNELKKAGMGILEVSVAMWILAKAVKSMAGLSWEDLAKGLTVMAAGLAGIVIAAKEISEKHLADDMVMLGGSLLMLGGAMIMLATASKLMQGVEWETLAKMGVVLAAALVGLGLASHYIDGANLLMIGGAIFLVANAFLALNAALAIGEIVGPIMTSIGAAISGIGSSLQSFAGNAAAQAFLDFLENLILFLPRLAVGLAKAIADLVVELANAVGRIVPAVVNIAKECLKGLREVVPELFALLREIIAQVILTLQEAIPQVFETIRIFFEQLWIFLTEQTPRAFEFLTLFFEQLWQFLTAQLPNFFTFLTTAVTELLTFIQNTFPMISQTIFLCLQSVLQDLLNFLNTNGPLVAETLLQLLDTVLNVIDTAIPKIVETLLHLLSELLDKLAEYVPQMADAALRILQGFLKAIEEHIGEITESAITIAVEFIKGVASKMDEIVDAAFKLIIGFIEGLAKAIEENHMALFEAIGHLIKAIVEAIIDGVVHLAEAAGELISGFLGEFDPGKLWQDLVNIGANFVNGIIEGVGNFAQGLWDAAANLGQGMLNSISGALDENSPSKEGYKIGAYFDEGVGQGIDDGANPLYDKAANVGYGMLDAFGSALDSQSFNFSPNVGTGALKQQLLLEAKYDPLNELGYRMDKMDTYTLESLLNSQRVEDPFTNEMIAEFNALPYEEQISEYGETLSGMIDYNTRLATYRNARIDYLSHQADNQVNNGAYANQLSEYGNAQLDALTQESLNNNAYNQSILGQSEYGNNIADYGNQLGEYGNTLGEYDNTLGEYNVNQNDEMINQLGSISGQLSTINSSVSDSTSATQGLAGKADAIRQKIISSGAFSRIATDAELEKWLDEVKNNNDDNLIATANYSRENDSLAREYDAMSNEEKNSKYGLDLLAMITYSQAISEYAKALLDERNNAVNPIQTSSTSSVSKASTSSYSSNLNTPSKVDLTPATTSSISQSVSSSSQNIADQFANQNEVFAKLLKSEVGDKIYSLKTTTDSILTSVNNIKHNIYMDTGELVGAIAPEIDGYLGYKQIMTSRGVV